MKRVAVVAAIVVAALAGYWAGFGFHKNQEQPQETKKQVLYWYDPMYPQHKFDKPGKSPYMDMQLVPKYAGEEAGQGTVSISPRVVQNLGVRTAEAKAGALQGRFEAVGSVAYKLALVAAGAADATWTLRGKHEWDVAAGTALVRAAGGTVWLPHDGEPHFNRRNAYFGGFAAASATAVERVRALLRT